MPLARTTLSDPRPTDILIPVVGLTGAGKSTFINEVLRAGGKGEAPVKVSSSLDQCTTSFEFVVVEQEVEKYPLLRGSRVILIDTPGFKNPCYVDLETLHRLSLELKGLYPRCKPLVQGLVYIHDLTVDRQVGTAASSIVEYFRRLPGHGSSILSRTLLAASKWGCNRGVNYEQKESELMDSHWKGLVNPKGGQSGATVKRLGAPGEGSAALDAIHAILHKLNRAAPEETRVLHSPLQPEDLVVLVMGPTGAGRSTFINALLRESGGKEMKVGHSQDPCTTEVHCAILDLGISLKCKKKYRVLLVDTPGFNDSDQKKTDHDILEAILLWLQEWMKPTTAFRAGVIYLQDISIDPFPAMAKVDSAALRKNLNSSLLKQLSFVTTKWKYAVDAEVRHNKFAHQIEALVSADSKVHRFEDDEDAWSALQASLLSIEASPAVDIEKVLAAVRATTQKRPRKRDGPILARLFGLFERFSL